MTIKKNYLSLISEGIIHIVFVCLLSLLKYSKATNLKKQCYLAEMNKENDFERTAKTYYYGVISRVKNRTFMCRNAQRKCKHFDIK
jgi:hypothetical protein